MSVISGQLVQTKISAGSVGEFGQSLRTFVPDFQVCPARPAFDYAGREASPDSINTQQCPGAFPASLRIDVENSLRPFVSPTYFNLPIGISGNADTMFGQQATSRLSAFGYQQNIPINIDDLAQGSYAGQKNINTDISSMGYGNIAQKYTGNLSLTPQFGSADNLAEVEAQASAEQFRFLRRQNNNRIMY